jgi:hypothetical protein
LFLSSSAGILEHFGTCAGWASCAGCAGSASLGGLKWGGIPRAC